MEVRSNDPVIEIRMRVNITDREALSALSPMAVAAYLRARGWSAVESDTAFAVFERLEGKETLGLEVPLRPSAGDYARRLAELLHNLELIERRSQLDIFRDLIHADQDVARLPVGESRHELIDGRIVAVGGGSDEHNAIAGRFAGLFAAHVPSGCLYYTPDQRFWIAATARGRYSDGSIICGKPAHPAHDDRATTNPSVVVEVRPLSREGDDDRDKRRDFQSLASLQAYVIAAQDARCVWIHRRAERGEWRDEPDVYRDGERFELPRLTRAIAVDEVYDGVLDAAGRSLLR